MLEINKIQEIYKGHYQVVLDYPTANDLTKILDVSCEYVWVVDHNEGRTTWQPYLHTLYAKEVSSNELIARNIKMEYLMDTTSFLEILPNIKQTVHLIQIKKKPPYYFNLDKFKGRQKYDSLLREMDYRLEIEIPGATDYAPLVSPDRSFLEAILKKFT